MNSWRLILNPQLPGTRQMAIDEALYRCVTPQSRPVLRFYSWRTPTLSLGYFQKYKTIVQEPFCVDNNIDVVRRLTGGRAVLHHEEVTYAVVASLEHGTFQAHSLRETYQLIAQALNLGLQQLGFQGSSVISETSAHSSTSRSAQCFVSASRYEISSGQKKMIGSAQKRSRDRFLQHGSILLDFDSLLQSGCIQKADPQLENRIAPLQRLLNRKISFDDLVQHFKVAFETSFQTHLELSGLSEGELKMADEFEEKYRSMEWTQTGCK
jgi:lipoate-protein ligase A